MIKMIELRNVISDSLKSVHPRVYFNAAPKGAVFPYLVYDLPNSVDDGYLEQFVIDVDGWDSPLNGDTTALETIMDGVKQSLDGLSKVVEPFVMSFYFDNRLVLTDDNPNIKRRKYTFQARTYEGRFLNV